MASNFDLSTAVAVREREDGLLEKPSFDLSTAIPISEPPKQEKQNWELLKDPGFKADWEIMVKDVPKQLQDVLNVPAHIYNALIPQPVDPNAPRNQGIPVEPFTSELFTKSFPRLYEAITIPGGLKSLATGEEPSGRFGDISILEGVLLGFGAKAAIKSYSGTVDFNMKLEQAGRLAGEQAVLKTEAQAVAQNIAQDLSKYEKMFVGEGSAGFPKGTTPEDKVKIIMDNMKSNPALQTEILTDTSLRLHGINPSTVIETTGYSIEGASENLFSKLKQLNQLVGERGSIPIKRAKVGQKVIYEGRPGEIVGLDGKVASIRLIGDVNPALVPLSQLSLPKVEQPTEGKVKYLYHGTGEGAFRKIREQGLMPQALSGSRKYTHFADTEKYAKTYAELKQEGFGERLIRVKQTPDIMMDERIPDVGDYRTEKPIPPENIEVKVGNKWIPIQEYSNEAINIMPISKLSPKEVAKGGEITVYRGTRDSEKRFEGEHYSEDKSFAKKFGEVKEYKINTNNVLDITDINTVRKLFGEDIAKSFESGNFWQSIPDKDGFTAKPIDKVIAYAKEQGYSGIKYVENFSRDIRPTNYLMLSKLSTPTSAKAEGEGQKPPVEPPKTAVSGSPEEQPKPKKLPLSERVDIVNQAKERLQEVDTIRKNLLHRITKYKDGYLAEELKELPAHYITKEGGLKPDQIIEEINNSNMGVQLANETELVDYLKGLDAEHKNLVQAIKENKPELISQYETTIAKNKEKVQEQMKKKAFKEMQKMAEEQAKVTAKIEKKAFKSGKELGAEIRKKKYFGETMTKDQRRELYVVAMRKGVIYTDYAGKEHDKLRAIIKYYKGASFDQLKEYLSSLSGDPENPSKLFKLYGDIDRDAEALKLINQERLDWRDINKTEVYTLDPYRTIEKVTEKDVWDDNILADNSVNVIAAADDAMIDRKAKEFAELEAIREGVMSGSKESAEIQRKFEAKEPLTPKEQRIANFLRAKYDAWIKEANEMRALLGKKPIPYRQDYMTHILEQNILNEFFKGDESGMKGISEGQLDAIRKGDYTKGNMPFNRFAQQRLTDKTKYDAIGNYLKYLDVITKEIYYTPAISHARKFIEYALNKQPNAYKSLDRLLNDLKGKTSIVDQNLIGAFAGSKPVMWLRSHIARSALVGNINFWAMNLSNFATAYPEIGNYVNVGMAKFLGSKEWRKFAFENSLMLKGRAIDPDFIDQPIHTKLEETVGAITNLIEYNNVGSVFVGAYHKAIEQLKYPKEKAIAYADSIARKTQVGYKPYEVNAWMRSNSGKLMSQFQTWTFNAMNYMLYDVGTANIPEDIKNMFTDTKTNRTRWGILLKVLATVITVNALYRKAKLREPLSINAMIPTVAGLTPGRYNDIGPNRVAKDIISYTTSKKKETRVRARNRLATAVVPGGAQLNRFSQGRIFPTNKKTTKKVR